MRRKGKELVPKAFIAGTDLHGEYGRVVLERTHPFVSSTSDVAQVAVRANTDIQYVLRGLPEEARETLLLAKPAASIPCDALAHWYRSATLSPAKKKMISLMLAGMQASNNADFYITKYQAKQLQLLGPVLRTISSGVQRLRAEQETGEQARSTYQKALATVRRIAFSAQRCAWFSACELAICLMTGSMCYSSHATWTVYLQRCSFMMRQCKRHRMKEIPEKDIIYDPDKEPRQQNVIVFRDNEEELQEPDGESGSVPSLENTRPLAQTTTCHDDWLHRGYALQSMPFYVYVAWVKRSLKSALAEDHPRPTFHFDTHYPMSRLYIQELRREMVLPVLEGWQAVRADASNGEDNAMFHALLSTVVCCQGPGRCSDPQLFNDTVFACNFGGKRRTGFRAAWKARRAWIEKLATVADSKLELEKRVAVPLDTTLCRTWPPPGARDATAHGRAMCLPRSESVCSHRMSNARLPPCALPTESGAGMRHAQFAPSPADEPPNESEAEAQESFCAMAVCVKALVRHMIKMRSATRQRDELKEALCSEDHDNRECIEGLLAQFLRGRSLWHPQQLHLAEYCAHFMRDVITNADCIAESRHMRNRLVADAAGIEADVDAVEQPVDPEGKVEFEGGGGADGDAEDVVEELGADDFEYHISLTTGEACKLLRRHFEIEQLNKPGRPKQGCKDMRDYLGVFEDLMIRAESRCVAPGATDAGVRLQDPDAAKRFQAARAKELVKEMGKDEEDRALGPSVPMESADPEVAVVDVEKALLSPREFAWQLIAEAGANEEQILAAALFTHPLQLAWADRKESEQSDNLELPLDKPIFRGVFIGGGGCGKTHVINKILRPLIERFYGRGCCITVAPTNKAARLVRGKTLHHAVGLPAAATFKASRLRPTGKVATQLECRFATVAAWLLDEWSQAQGQLLSACALRLTYARQKVFQLIVDRFAEAGESFGRLPFVVMSGDELQLPPVPKEAGLLHNLDDASDEHKIGVKLFRELQYVFRFRKSMRFTDQVQISILEKMRCTGGRKLTQAEWSRLLGTRVETRQGGLRGTETWQEAAYQWSVVTLAQYTRALLSAERQGQRLYLVQAADVIRQGAGKPQDYEKLLREPNMSTTGRIMGFCPVHIGMRVRLTRAVEKPLIPTDSEGRVVGITFHEMEPWGQHGDAAVVALKFMPKQILVKIDDFTEELLPPDLCPAHASGHAGSCALAGSEGCPDCARYTGVVAVTPTNSVAWQYELDKPKDIAPGQRARQVSVTRRGFAMAPADAHTLYSLQGTTADPGLIFHWNMPKTLPKLLKWLAIYVALSRVRSLDNLVSVHLTTAAREVIEGGPPEELREAFQRLLGDADGRGSSPSSAWLAQVAAAPGGRGSVTATQLSSERHCVLPPVTVRRLTVCSHQD